MIHFDRRTGILLLRLPTHDIPFHYGADTEEGQKDMVDAEAHVAKILAALDDNCSQDLSEPTLHDIAMLKDRLDWLEERISSGFKERPRCVDCGAAIPKGKCRCEKCTKLKPIAVDCPTCCAGPLEKVPRSDCPTCHGTGKIEVL
jgi:hypothetical protein